MRWRPESNPTCSITGGAGAVRALDPAGQSAAPMLVVGLREITTRAAWAEVLGRSELKRELQGAC
jgi:hypothetical protein